MSAKGTGTPRRGARVLGIGFVALFVLICAVAIGGYYAYSSRPDHWTQQQQRIAEMNPQERQRISEALFNHATTKWSESPPDAATIDELIGQRSTLTIPYEDLNVWLAEDGVDLLSGVGIKMPRSVKGAMIDSTGDGLLRISCDVQTPRFEQVVALTFEIEVADDGTVVSKLKSASAGLLPLPRDKAIDLIAKRIKDNDRMLALMRGTPTGPIDVPIDASEDGLRDGRLVGFEVGDDALVITRETVRRRRTEDQ